MFEVEVGEDGAGEHRGEGQVIAVVPVEFREVVEVHAVDAGDQRWRQEDDGGPAEQLHRRVQLDADVAEAGVEKEGQIVGEECRGRGERGDVGGEAGEVVAGGDVGRLVHAVGGGQ